MLALALLAVPAAGSDAEELATLEEGALIKVTVTTSHDGKSRSETIKGTLVEWGETFITLIPENSIIPMTIDRKLVTKLQTRTDPSRRGRSALIGLGVGAGLGALIGYADGDDPPGMMSMDRTAKAATGAVTLGLVGALVGVLIGPGERWDDVRTKELFLNLGSMPNGETGFIITRRF